MCDPIQLGKAAAAARKTRQGRGGRTFKGDAMSKHLHAAGKPKMDTPGIFAFPRGSKV